jgi:hypothetical protein
MKPYGVPRDKDVEYPDVGSIKRYGLKTSVGGKDYFKNKKNKAAARRIWKKLARRMNKALGRHEKEWRD